MSTTPHAGRMDALSGIIFGAARNSLWHGLMETGCGIPASVNKT